jgi:hypothetical protein
MAAETTKFQVNFKTHKDGTLINIYADSVKDLETQITDISMLASLIKATERELLSGPNAPLSPEQVAKQLGAVPVPANKPTAPAEGGHICKHGNMPFREGVSAKGPWKGYMCAAPKGATDKCPTIWVR